MPMTETNKLRVSILEDNELLRSNMVHYLLLSNMYVPAYAGGQAEELMGLTEADPDFILLDIHLKGCNGLDLIPKLKVRFPESQIVIITGDNSEELVLQAFKKGAKGYLYKPFSMNNLLDALKSTGEQGYYMTPTAISNLLQQINKEEQMPGIREQYHFTEKELQIVNLVKEGLSYSEIANKLFISYHTVNHHLKNIYIKTNVRSKSELLSKLLFKVHTTDNEPQKNPSGR
jgi:DNA-binding NarL/FixJ family response regulator